MRPLQQEVAATPVVHNGCYFVAAPEHPLHGRTGLCPNDLDRQSIFYEPLYRELIGFIHSQLGMPVSTPDWHLQESYESVYADLLAGRAMFFCPMRYPFFPAEWYLPLALPRPLPDTCLLTLRDDPRPEIGTLIRVFLEVYHSFGLC